MSIIRKVEVALAAVLLGLVVFLAIRVAYFKHEAATAQETAHVAVGDAKAATVYADKIQRVTAEKEVKNAAVQTVIDGNRAWADEPLPTGTAELLRNPAGTSRDVP